MKPQVAIDKLFSHKLFSNKYFLYAIVTVSILSNYMHIVASHYEVVGFFILVGIIMMNFSKNIAVVLTVCLLLTQLIVAGRSVQEGFDTNVQHKMPKTLIYINNDKNHFPGISGEWAVWLERPENQTKYNLLYEEAKKLENELKSLNELWVFTSKIKDPVKLKTKNEDLQCLTYKYNLIPASGVTERCKKYAGTKGIKDKINDLVKRIRDKKRQDTQAAFAAAAAAPAATTSPATTTAATTSPATTSTPSVTRPVPKEQPKTTMTIAKAMTGDRKRKQLLSSGPGPSLLKNNFALLNDNDTDANYDSNGIDLLEPSNITGITQGTTDLITKQKGLYSVMNSIAPLIENAKKMLNGMDLSKLQPQ